MQMCWMQSIDFLITLNLLNNQATANALVISIQFTTQLCLHTCQGHSPLCYCVLCVKVAQKDGGKCRVYLSSEMNIPVTLLLTHAVRMSWHSIFSLRAMASLSKATSWKRKICDLVISQIFFWSFGLSLWSFNRLRGFRETGPQWFWYLFFALVSVPNGHLKYFWRYFVSWTLHKPCLPPKLLIVQLGGSLIVTIVHQSLLDTFLFKTEWINPKTFLFYLSLSNYIAFIWRKT